MNVGIVGAGVVGSAVRHGMLKLGHKVSVHDVKMNTSLEDVMDTQVCFICVPTKTVAKAVDMAAVDSVLAGLDDYDYGGVVALKSTVLPGTTDYFINRYQHIEITYCPEFLRERSAEVDFTEHMDVLVVGAYRSSSYETLKLVHGNLPKKSVLMTPPEAEFVKYFSNTFNAMRIVFANSFASVCEAGGVDYQTVKNCAVLRDNIPDYYLDCNELLRGYGGTCLPKDTEAFAAFTETLAPHVKLFRTIVDENKHYPETIFNGMRRYEQ